MSLKIKQSVVYLTPSEGINSKGGNRESPHFLVEVLVLENEKQQ